MEYLDGGELFERVAGEDFNLTESDCCQFMKQICRLLLFLLLLMMLFLQLVSHVTVSVVVSLMVLKVMMIVSVGDHLENNESGASAISTTTTLSTSISK